MLRSEHLKSRLLLSAAMLLLFAACRTPYPALPPAAGIDPKAVQQLRPVFGTVVYQTQVDVVGKHLSGLLVFKTMPDSSKRVVFTSETGPTLFDFELGRTGGFKVYYCIKSLKRKAVLRTLRKDFELLLMQNIGTPAPAALRDSSGLVFPFRNGKETNYYRADPAGSRLLGAEKTGRRKPVVRIQMAPLPGEMPDSADIRHLNFNFAIRLRVLRRPN